MEKVIYPRYSAWRAQYRYQGKTLWRTVRALDGLRFTAILEARKILKPGWIYIDVHPVKSKLMQPVRSKDYVEE